MFTLTTSLALFLSLITPNTNVLALTTIPNAPIVKAESAEISLSLTESEPKEKFLENIQNSVVSMEQYVKTYYAETPILAKIASCESQYRQFSSGGNVLRGREVYEDVGVMQINETYHKAIAQNLGYNILSLDGNLAYAKYLYDHQGASPWSASKSCWGS